MLTEKQRNNINKLDSETVIEILNECIERLGIVSIKEYIKITGEKKRTVYWKIKNNKIRYIEIDNNKFIIINL
jgi:DNA invertase Pin-like site-specific DNA recombinase